MLFSVDAMGREKLAASRHHTRPGSTAEAGEAGDH